MNIDKLVGNGWSYDGGKLTKTFKFPSFMRAFGWMTSVAIKSEKMNHHPEWFNVYNRVEVVLTTHDAGNTVTTRDIELANFMDKLYGHKPH